MNNQFIGRMASLRLLSISLNRLSISSKQTVSKAVVATGASPHNDPWNTVQVREMTTRRFPGMKRNSRDFYHIIRERRHFLPNFWKIKTTRSKRFPGHIDIYNKKGERDALDAAVQRFKRLDWGSYVRVMIGRRNKVFRKTEARLWAEEQHVFAWKNFM